MTDTILIVGGAGYIGSHMSHFLRDKQRDILILDNLSTGHQTMIDGLPFVKGEISDKALLDKIFSENAVRTVMHFASSIEVGESVQNPGKYFDNNISTTITLLNKMVEHNVKEFIFSSTAATFGTPLYVPIDEKHTQAPINPYGKSKLIVEHMLKDYEAAYGLRYGILRYFNAAGASSTHRIGEWHEPESHLIPLVLQVASKRRADIKVFGTDYPTKDGSCIRDYIHVEDLCDAHLRLIDYLRAGGQERDFNLGTGKGYSVLDVIKAVENVTSQSITTEHTAPRDGDPAELIADGRKAREILEWNPNHSSLENIVTTAWTWEQQLAKTLDSR